LLKRNFRQLVNYDTTRIARATVVAKTQLLGDSGRLCLRQLSATAVLSQLMVFKIWLLLKRNFRQLSLSVSATAVVLPTEVLGNVN
jgi:hypothetical protein